MRNRNDPAPTLDAPIPGQGMTAPLGGRPWQRPPQYKTADEALAFYLDRITGERQVSQMLDILELGVPVDSLVNSMTLGGVMEGLHSADVKSIIEPALAEAIASIADEAEVEYKLLGDEIDEEAPTDVEIALGVNKLKEKQTGIRIVDEKDTVQEEPVEEETTEPVSRGLMSRRV